MSVVGIIAEYNPLHNGHAYHIERAKSLSASSACVCVLSSNFVQRGESALINKWARAKMALYGGADLIVELPTAFSCSSAEYFASGAIKILHSLNCVDHVCFGSEEGKLGNLEKVANLLAFETDDFKSTLKHNLNKGLSYAVSRQAAIEKHLTDDGSCIPPSENGTEPILGINMPNNILGIEYLKALKRLKSSIKPITIERLGQGYNSQQRAESFSSATSIRSHIIETFDQNRGFVSDSFLKSNIPQNTLNILEKEFREGRGPISLEAYENILLYLLRTIPETQLVDLPYMGEGLENRLKKASSIGTSLEEVISAAVTSRYPASRIRRILCSLLTGMTGALLDELKANGYAQYIRVLGFNNTGRELLSHIRKKALLPVITKAAHYVKLENPLAIKLFQHEIRSTDTYVLAYPDSRQRKVGIELTTSPIVLKRE